MRFDQMRTIASYTPDVITSSKKGSVSARAAYGSVYMFLLVVVGLMTPAAEGAPKRGKAFANPLATPSDSGVNSKTGITPSTTSHGPATNPESDAIERVNVDTIREKYWARGEESELGVVQSRLYSKARKFELGAYGGLVFSDPFLSIQSAGLTAGYHFTEYFSLHVMGYKDFVGKSSALTTFEETVKATSTLHATTQNNPPRYFLGAEAMGSILYGKLSLLGQAIIYYDFHLLGGLGIRNTESGSYLAPLVGIGQQVYLSQAFSLRLDYRLMAYREQLVEKVITTRLGESIGHRINYSNLLTLGVTFLFGGPK